MKIEMSTGILFMYQKLESVEISSLLKNH